MTNLLKRQARRSMSQGLGKDEAFFQWANDYFQMCPEKELPIISPEHSGFLNTFIIKQVAFENFQQRLSFKQKQDYRINKFKQHVISFCEYWGYELNPRTLKDVDSGGRILKNIDGKTAECFYISTANAPNVPQPIQNEPLNNLTHDEEDMPF